MRRAVAGACLLALTLAAAPADAQPKRPVRAARSLVIVGDANTSLDIVVPSGVTLAGRAPGLASPGFADLGASGAWGSVALISRGTKVAGKPINVVQVHTSAPDHCPPASAPTTEPAPRCRPLVEHVSSHGTAPSVDGLAVRYPLPAGTYQVALAGPPGTRLVAELTFTGVGGEVRARTSRRITGSWLERSRHEGSVAAQVTGSFTRRLTTTGLAVLGAWHTTAGEEQGPSSYAHCVTPGTAGPLDPDGCLPFSATRQGRPAQLGPTPAFAAMSAPEETGQDYAALAVQTPLLKPGTYVDSYRVTRVGRGPAVGAFAFWLQTDALR